MELILTWIIFPILIIFGVSWVMELFAGKDSQQKERERKWREEQEKLGNFVDTPKSNLQLVGFILMCLFAIFYLST
ncbi:hypothetical protein M9B41_06135 [SAR86 cluster bacterium]|nr:hypothetical protein M9B41_06135 [SAR86 cluster bacterium]